MNNQTEIGRKMNDQEEINLQISVDEANLLLEALGNLPFARVFALIGKLQEQAGQQLNTNGKQDEADKTEYPAPDIKE